MSQSCLECFQNSGKSGSELQIAVDESFPGFACECERCSPYSPGPVANDEDLAFILVEPVHYDPVTETISPDAFQELTRRDLSLIRLEKATQSDFDKTVETLIQGRADNQPKRAVQKVCLADAASIRSVNIDGSRIFAVYDTALEHSNAHASIFTTKAAIQGDKVTRKRVRQACHSTLSKRVMPANEVRANLRTAI